MKVTSSDGFSPDTSDLHGTKVSVTVAIFIWGSIRVQIIPDKMDTCTTSVSWRKMSSRRYVT
jgi:hypothetical protein